MLGLDASVCTCAQSFKYPHFLKYGNSADDQSGFQIDQPLGRLLI